jgi:hypothetical protein
VDQRLVLALLVPLAAARGQSVRLYSEFQRIDPFGNILAADRAERPREILSPALARNAFASFQIAVGLPREQSYGLYIGQNPENSVQVTLYRQHWNKRGSQWYPDDLAPLVLSESGMVPAIPPQVTDQKVVLLWMDLWVSPQMPVRRTRLEVQLNVGDHWMIYPLELRIQSPIVPAHDGPFEPLAPIDAPAAQTAATVLRGYLCGPGKEETEGPLTIRRLIRRNARQDLALARQVEPLVGRSVLMSEILKAVGAADLAVWCQEPNGSGQLGSEWYLRARDTIYRTVRERGAGEPLTMAAPR